MLLLILKGHFRIAVKTGIHQIEFPKYAYNSVLKESILEHVFLANCSYAFML